MVQKTKNPFTPTFGHVPFALAGRTSYIDDVIDGLANYPDDPNRSTIFIGSRGSGKTVLLTALLLAGLLSGRFALHARKWSARFLRPRCRSSGRASSSICRRWRKTTGQVPRAVLPSAWASA